MQRRSRALDTPVQRRKCLLCEIVVQRELIALSDGLLDAAVGPESLDRGQEVFRQRVVRADFVIDQDMRHVLLRHQATRQLTFFAVFAFLLLVFVSSESNFRGRSTRRMSRLGTER